MARPVTSRKNLFGFGKKKVTTFKHRGSTRRDISSLAYKAGQRSGDTGLFSSWADSKNLKDHWDRDALREFENSYRAGVEKGEAREQRQEEKQAEAFKAKVRKQAEKELARDRREELRERDRKAKAEAKQRDQKHLEEVQSDVIEALAGLGMSRSQAKTLARSKYRQGDSFGELFDRIMKRSPVGNPQSSSQLGKAGWRLVDKFRTRETAAAVFQKYGPARLIYRSGLWEVWTRQGVQNPAKFDRCVSDVKKSGRPGNAYAICTAAGTRNPRAAYYVVKSRAIHAGPYPSRASAARQNISNDRIVTYKEAEREIKAGTLKPGPLGDRWTGWSKNPPDFDSYWEKEGEKAGHAYPLNDYMQVWNALPIKRQLQSMKTGRDISNDMVRALRHFKSGFERGKQHGLRSRLSKKNPLESAKKAYSDFTGLPATEVIEVKEQAHRHSTVFKTGQLVCLDIITPEGKEIPLVATGFQLEPKRFLRRDLRHSHEAEAAEATWIFDPAAKAKTVMVTFSEDGKQMMFTGGDQAIPLESLGFGDRDMRDNMFIGTIIEITYRGRKKFEHDGKEEVDFHHEFGKQGSQGMLPLLGYYLRTKQMFSLGGRYKIAPVRSDIGASPGIVG